MQQSATIATHLTSYATKIDTVHAAIVDLLSRICNPLTGIKEVWEFLTDEDEDEIKNIANDIRVIVNQFTAEVDALRQQIATALDEAETILGTWPATPRRSGTTSCTPPMSAEPSTTSARFAAACFRKRKAPSRVCGTSTQRGLSSTQKGSGTRYPALSRSWSRSPE